ncbi:MAG: hypothetical protein QGI86_17120 [Candidatus Poribacteria bacterium]|nr:hypothetical protein [Candidatus Poribacteria bacterium]MDP6751564.1 hypothetical protein [Candidatus Poribacteria bacterium]MDP6997898.1 hypothetical protein [Candidatus Poribacteria bacterium]
MVEHNNNKVFHIRRRNVNSIHLDKWLIAHAVIFSTRKSDGGRWIGFGSSMTMSIRVSIYCSTLNSDGSSVPNLAQEMEEIVYGQGHQSSRSLAEVSGVTDLDKDDFWLTFRGQLSIILRF